MKIASFLLTFFLNLFVSGLLVVILMLVLLNGYSESDAMWGLFAYGALALISSLIMGVGAVLLSGALAKRQFKTFSAAAIGIVVFVIIGTVLDLVFGLIGVGITEFVRVNY